MATTAEPRGNTGAGRLLAWVAIACASLLGLALVAFTARNVVDLLAALAGFAVAVAGAWWLASRRPPHRWLGLVGVAVGLGTVAVAVVRAATGAERPVVRLAIALGLYAAMTAAARQAVLRATPRPDHSGDPGQPDGDGGVRRSPPSHPVLICNPWSGGGKVERFGLVERARELGVEVVLLDHGLDLEQLARDAVARGADCLGMAGGDGSQALVASIAVEHDLPFVCISAGTRNHFALDLGLVRDDPRPSLDAFRDAVERRIDHATVNGRFFVNNVSLGVYATVVQEDGYRDAKAETTKALLPELLGDAERPFDLQFTTPDGEEVDGAYLIQISNNPYAGGAALDALQRRRLDRGQLGVIAITGTSGREAAAIAASTLVGRRGPSRGWHELTTDVFEVRSRSGSVFAGVDGEALELPTPLVCRIHPGGLRLLVPAGNLEAAARRWARDVTIGRLVGIALGRPS
jgi:diacylglycerol kinase family enzyme